MTGSTPRVGNRAKPGGWKRSLWSLVSRLFGTPRGRHVAGVPPPPPPPDSAAPVAEAPALETSSSELPPTDAAELEESEIADGIPAPASVASVVRKSVPAAATPVGLASVRLIFTDGSVVPLPPGSIEERQAQYLARRVLEAGGRG